MNLFIFGAGASYGSDLNALYLPPLASNLFDIMVPRYPGLSGNTYLMSLANVFKNDFELGVLKLYEMQPHFLSVFQRCMSHFFFQYGISIPIGKDNLYYKLAQQVQLKQSNIALATLNYERLLELCCLEAGINLTCNSITNDEQIEICLPHGYCNLFCDSVQSIQGGIILKAGASLKCGAGNIMSFSNTGNVSIYPMNIATNGNINAINDPSIFEKRIRNDAFPPVMSYFDPAKFTTSGANFIASQRNRFAQLISEASKIAVIGIKIRTHDDHIWKPLKGTSAKIIYCSGKEAAIEYEQWRTGIVTRKDDIIFSNYWREEFHNINTEML